MGVANLPTSQTHVSLTGHGQNASPCAITPAGHVAWSTVITDLVSPLAQAVVIIEACSWPRHCVGALHFLGHDGPGRALVGAPALLLVTASSGCTDAATGLQADMNWRTSAIILACNWCNFSISFEVVLWEKPLNLNHMVKSCLGPSFHQMAGAIFAMIFTRKLIGIVFKCGSNSKTAFFYRGIWSPTKW